MGKSILSNVSDLMNLSVTMDPGQNPRAKSRYHPTIQNK